MISIGSLSEYGCTPSLKFSKLQTEVVPLIFVCTCKTGGATAPTSSGKNFRRQSAVVSILKDLIIESLRSKISQWQCLIHLRFGPNTFLLARRGGRVVEGARLESV